MACDQCGSKHGHSRMCVLGRCGMQWNPGVWPFTTRCVKEGKQGHGNTHEDNKGRTINGKWMSLHDYSQL